MHSRRLAPLSLALGLSAAIAAGCGGTDAQPEMPDPSRVDPLADDLGLAEAPPEEEGSGGEASAPAAPIRVVREERSAIEGASPTLRIVAPRAGERIAEGPANLRLRLTNWPLQPAPGQHVHVIIDNEPYIAIRDVSAPLDLNALSERHLGHPLSEGTHVVRVFPSRGHHESVKEDGAFAMVLFHYRHPTEGHEFNPQAPLLTYSRPKGCNVVGNRVLLDFYLSNVELSADGHRVHWEIDGTSEGDITNWSPHYIENLPAGSHSLRLSLVDGQGVAVSGIFNSAERRFDVRESCE